MIVDDRTISAAFDKHWERYGRPEQRWPLPYHIQVWRLAQKAIDQRSLIHFQKLHDELRRKWLLARGGGPLQSHTEIFEKLGSLDSTFGRRALSTLDTSDLSAVWSLIQSVKGLKVNKPGPSVVAVSKFLHFWNPRFFMIVDDALIWRWVLGRWWLRQQFEEIRREVQGRLPNPCPRRPDESCDLTSYLAILVWAGHVLRDNPGIVRHFGGYLTRGAEDASVPPEFTRYEAVAVEWFLLGLVELLPPGVRV